jgi:L-amino acid N-acyltransferase YncA
MPGACWFAGTPIITCVSSVSSAIRIRPVTPDDAAGIVAVMNPIIAARCYTVFDAPFTVDAERAFIAGFSARGIFHVAVDERDGRIVGLQNLEPVANYTRAMDHVASIGTYVDLNRRREGIAGRLFAASLPAARAKGFEKLFTFVRADNPAALATYQRHGFEVIGTAKRHTKIDGEYVDETLIEKLL